MSSAAQDDIVNTTVLSPLSIQYPATVCYQKTFLKYIIGKLEQAGVTEISDLLYEQCTALLNTQSNEEFCYKSYRLPDGMTVSLRESVHLVSAGTTGLCGWPAARHLAEWALQHSDLLQRRRVLELGSGSGFTGVVICAQCQPLRYTFTDCHDNVLSALAANVALNVRSSLANHKSRNNGLHAACDGASTGSETKTKVMKLDWETVSIGELEELAQETDVILAADVVYDCEIVEALVRVFHHVLHEDNVAYVASTIRNDDTRQFFLKALVAASIQYRALPPPTKEVFYYERNVKIEIIELRKENTK